METLLQELAQLADRQGFTLLITHRIFRVDGPELAVTELRVLAKDLPRAKVAANLQFDNIVSIKEI